ncbi:MAG: hypothetical protein WCW66_00840 [Patescibacteria group bacterium]
MNEFGSPSPIVDETDEQIPPADEMPTIDNSTESYAEVREEIIASANKRVLNQKSGNERYNEVAEHPHDERRLDAILEYLISDIDEITSDESISEAEKLKLLYACNNSFNSRFEAYEKETQKRGMFENEAVISKLSDKFVDRRSEILFRKINKYIAALKEKGGQEDNIKAFEEIMKRDPGFDEIIIYSGKTYLEKIEAIENLFTTVEEKVNAIRERAGLPE